MKFLLLLTGCALLAPLAQAQSFCASEGQATPTLLVERFMNADCEACWGKALPELPTPQALILDWIVPSAQGDEAPLSAAASREALERLQALGIPPPQDTRTHSTPVPTSPALALRVGHGVAVGGYLGASIELKIRPSAQAWGSLSAWLVLVETIAAGVDGTPVARNLVRNVLITNWNVLEQLTNKEQLTLREMRPLSLPAGTNPERLRVVGWVQNARGQVLKAAQSVCLPSEAVQDAKITR
jgi:hypothetical protein